MGNHQHKSSLLPTSATLPVIGRKSYESSVQSNNEDKCAVIAAGSRPHDVNSFGNGNAMKTSVTDNAIATSSVLISDKHGVPRSSVSGEKGCRRRRPNATATQHIHNHPHMSTFRSINCFTRSSNAHTKRNSCGGDMALPADLLVSDDVPDTDESTRQLRTSDRFETATRHTNMKQTVSYDFSRNTAVGVSGPTVPSSNLLQKLSRKLIKLPNAGNTESAVGAVCVKIATSSDAISSVAAAAASGAGAAAETANSNVVRSKTDHNILLFKEADYNVSDNNSVDEIVLDVDHSNNDSTAGKRTKTSTKMHDWTRQSSEVVIDETFLQGVNKKLKAIKKHQSNSTRSTEAARKSHSKLKKADSCLEAASAAHSLKAEVVPTVAFKKFGLTKSPAIHDIQRCTNAANAKISDILQDVSECSYEVDDYEQADTGLAEDELVNATSTHSSDASTSGSMSLSSCSSSSASSLSLSSSLSSSFSSATSSSATASFSSSRSESSSHRSLSRGIDARHLTDSKEHRPASLSSMSLIVTPSKETSEVSHQSAVDAHRDMKIDMAAASSGVKIKSEVSKKKSSSSSSNRRIRDLLPSFACKSTRTKANIAAAAATVRRSDNEPSTRTTVVKLTESEINSTHPTNGELFSFQERFAIRQVHANSDSGEPLLYAASAAPTEGAAAAAVHEQTHTNDLRSLSDGLSFIDDCVSCGALTSSHVCLSPSHTTDTNPTHNLNADDNANSCTVAIQLVPHAQFTDQPTNNEPSPAKPTIPKTTQTNKHRAVNMSSTARFKFLSEINLKLPFYNKLAKLARSDRNRCKQQELPPNATPSAPLAASATHNPKDTAADVSQPLSGVSHVSRQEVTACHRQATPPSDSANEEQLNRYYMTSTHNDNNYIYSNDNDDNDDELVVDMGYFERRKLDLASLNRSSAEKDAAATAAAAQFDALAHPSASVDKQCFNDSESIYTLTVLKTAPLASSENTNLSVASSDYLRKECGFDFSDFDQDESCRSFQNHEKKSDNDSDLQVFTDVNNNNSTTMVDVPRHHCDSTSSEVNTLNNRATYLCRAIKF